MLKFYYFRIINKIRNLEPIKKYKKFFAENGEYHTGDSARGPVFINPSFTFWKIFIGIVFRSSKLAVNGLYDGFEWANSSIDIVEALEYAGVQFEFTGMDNIKSVEGPAVFISNHMSALETLVLPSIIQPLKSSTFVVKKELLSVPKFKHILSARNPIVVGRENPREDLMHVMDEGAKKIEEGNSIIIFPQSTRHKVFNPEAFNSLGVKLAKKNNVPVIPIALATDSWGNGKHIKELGRIDISKKAHISFASPIKADSPGINPHKYVTDFIIESLKKWGRYDCLPENLR